LALLTHLRQNQPNKPVSVTEYQPGWFDNWGGKHHTVTLQHFEQVVTEAVFKVNASLNFYMFIGGTNFGFMNGGHVITSYDYDAPLTESGLYSNSKNLSQKVFAIIIIIIFRQLYRKVLENKRIVRKVS
jgi:hypothetical protein